MQGADPDQPTTVDSSGGGAATNSGEWGPTASQRVGNGSPAQCQDGAMTGVALCGVSLAFRVGSAAKQLLGLVAYTPLSSAMLRPGLLHCLSTKQAGRSPVRRRTPDAGRHGHHTLKSSTMCHGLLHSGNAVPRCPDPYRKGADRA